MLAHDAGDDCAAHVCAHGLRTRDEVIPGSTFHGVVFLVDEHDHRILVMAFDRLAAVDM